MVGISEKTDHVEYHWVSEAHLAFGNSSGKDLIGSPILTA